MGMGVETARPMRIRAPPPPTPSSGGSPQRHCTQLHVSSTLPRPSIPVDCQRRMAYPEPPSFGWVTPCPCEFPSGPAPSHREGLTVGRTGQ